MAAAAYSAADAFQRQYRLASLKRPPLHLAPIDTLALPTDPCIRSAAVEADPSG